MCVNTFGDSTRTRILSFLKDSQAQQDHLRPSKGYPVKNVTDKLRCVCESGDGSAACK